jgi:mRNA interferase RelE/StbE
MTYFLDFKPLALRQISKLNKDIQDRVSSKIDALVDNPRPRGIIKLQGFENRYRIRVGDYRVIYEIHDNVLLVLVVEVVHRSGAYRQK